MNANKCTDTIRVEALSSTLSLSWNDWFKDGKRLLIGEVAGVLPMVHIYHHRWLSRRHLAKLNAVLLKDIGLNEDQVKAECAKPFWIK